MQFLSWLGGMWGPPRTLKPMELVTIQIYNLILEYTYGIKAYRTPGFSNETTYLTISRSCRLFPWGDHPWARNGSNFLWSRTHDSGKVKPRPM